MSPPRRPASSGLPPGDEDRLIACADLVGRAGARGFEVGYLRDDDTDPGWYAFAQHAGARIIAEGHRHPVAAAEDLARQLLTGARCAGCGRLVSLDGVSATAFLRATLADGTVTTAAEEQERASRRGLCHWTRTGRRWDGACGLTGGPRSKSGE